MRNPPIKIDAAGDVPTRQEQRNNRDKQTNTIFNEVRQFAYVLGVRERDFIDSTINTSKYQMDTFRDTIHEGSSPYL